MRKIHRARIQDMKARHVHSGPLSVLMASGWPLQRAAWSRLLDPIDPGSSRQRRSLATVLLALVALANRQDLRALELKHLFVVGARKLIAQHVVCTPILKAPPHGLGMNAFTQAHWVRIGLRWKTPGVAERSDKTVGPALRDLGCVLASWQWPCACPAGLALYPETDLELL